MIVTLTVNPALDRTIITPQPLRTGDVQPATDLREDAGGKGVNVSRVLAGAGHHTIAVLPLAADDPYRGVLGDAVEIEAVQTPGRARTNVAITDPAGVTTKLNLAGEPLTPPVQTEIIRRTVAVAATARWAALCGSLPAGTGANFYVEVARALRAAYPDIRIAVDTSGEPLTAIVASGEADLIKPNELELAELAGAPVPRTNETDDLVAAVVEIARRIVPSQVSAALVTLGAAGAVLIDATGAWHASAPAGVTVSSTVGAGDSSLAGYLLVADGERGFSLTAALDSAVRYGTATASLPGTSLAVPTDLSTAPIHIRSLS